MRLQYDIAVVGTQTVTRALGTVERRFNEHNRRMARRAGVAPGKARSGSSTADEMRVARLQQGVQRFQHKQALRQIAEQKREKIQAERAAGREAIAAEKRTDRLRRGRARARLRRIRASHREQMTLARARERFTNGAVGNVTGSVASSGRVIAGSAAGALTLGGGMMIGSSLREASTVDRMARRLLIASRGPGESGLMAPAELTGKIQSTAMVSGIGQEGIAEGLGAFVEKTGDLKTAVDNMQTFATIATATGADFRDVASAAADLSSKMDITSVEDMRQAFATLTFQGKQGAFELKNMAAEFPEILANARAVGIRGTEGVQQLGGFLQIARTSTGSAEETTTAVQQVFNQLAAKAGDIQSGKLLGKKVNVYEGGDQTGEMRNFRDVIADVIAASGGDMGKIIKTFDVRGKKAVTPFVSAYKDASLAAGGGKKGEAAGRAAIMKMFEDAAAAQGKFADVEKDAADALTGSAAELDRAFIEAKITLANELMPVFTDLVKSVTELAPTLKTAAKLVRGFAEQLKDNPISTIGLLIMAKTAASITSAHIGKKISNLLTSIIGGVAGKFGLGTGDTNVTGGGAGGATGGKGGKRKFLGAPSMGGALSAGGTGAALGLTAASLIITAGVANIAASEANMDQAGGTLKAARAAAAAGDVEGAKALFQQAQERLMETQKPGFVESVFGETAAGWIDPNRETELKTLNSFVEEMRTLMTEAEANRAKLQQEAATAQKEAAKAQSDAAGKLTSAVGNLAGPNRGNKPSPVKG